ncbi:TetR/AcrR family transcriptional regulator [Collinsella tanakaei]|uniref:TetR/AcrR family transcriptional regulator n=1 Tax=Collinsella tanakaei TaxID=626935 RepID=UPI0026587A21|nr:TetR/AcrR family transcriptional regulator [Collinsella tanakaei]
MARTVMRPDERRAELLDTAMRLFAEKGYDNVSVRAVARAAGVAPGLAYHYFDSKERMFAEAIGQYARRCAESVCTVLDNRDLSLDEKIERAVTLAGEHDFPYAGYFHGEQDDEGYDTLHDRLSLALCEEVSPHLAAALEQDARKRGERVADAGKLAAIMTYGCIGLASGPGMPDAASLAAARRYLGALVAEFRAGSTPAH